MPNHNAPPNPNNQNSAPAGSAFDHERGERLERQRPAYVPPDVLYEVGHRLTRRAFGERSREERPSRDSRPPQSRAEYHEEQARLRADRSADRERPASRQER